MRPSLHRFTGCLLGGALGDALGFPVEFVRPGAEIARRHGATAPHRLTYDASAKGLVSDDTQMTLFGAEGLVAARRAGAPIATPHVLASYQRWLGTQAMRAGEPPRPPQSAGPLMADARLHQRRAPGNTCLSALARSFTRERPATIDDPPNASKGCGAVMRSAPFGLAASDRAQAFHEAREAAVTTHGHPSGYLSAAYLASLVFDLAREAPLADAMRLADELLVRERDHAEMRAAMDRARRVAESGPPSIETIEGLGGGWVGEEALAIALVVTLSAGGGSPDRVAAALWRAVVHGGDSDSTGSIAGNLLGALYGDEGLPRSWLEDLELRDVVERAARELHEVAPE